jgi:RsiW-degrading membrane proteinase PrsW (M82 family)
VSGFFFIVLTLILAPAQVILMLVYQRDRTPTTVSKVIRYFSLGVASLFITLAITLLQREYLPWLRFGGIAGDVVKAFLLVGFVEELSKYFFVRWVAFYDREVKEPYDLIVYSLAVSMGFATLENMYYVFNTSMKVNLALTRMLTAIPAHATFAILMGYFMGVSRFALKDRRLLAISGLLAATIFHGIYDSFIFIGWKPGIWGGAFGSLLLGIYLSVKAMNLHSARRPFEYHQFLALLRNQVFRRFRKHPHHHNKS